MIKSVLKGLLLLVVTFQFLPLKALGGIPPITKQLSPRTSRLRVRPPVPPRPSPLLPLQNRPNLSPSLSTPFVLRPSPTQKPVRLEPPFQEEDFHMADAVFERLVSQTYAATLPQSFSPTPSRTRQAWERHSATPVIQHLFTQEAQELADLAQHNQPQYHYLEGQLFDLLCEWEKNSYFSKETFSQLQQAFFPHSLAARLYWAGDWARASQDTTRWPLVKPYDATASAPLAFQPDLVVVIVNDDEIIAKTAQEQLRGYAGHVLVAHDLEELSRFINIMKHQHLRPHYVIADAAIGYRYSDQDIRYRLKGSLPRNRPRNGIYFTFGRDIGLVRRTPRVCILPSPARRFFQKSERFNRRVGRKIPYPRSYPTNFAPRITKRTKQYV